ncbi:MAG: 4Fe-4S dicluster domain-containing protein [Myxococcota bacterium]|nr:4Fe-4S dicluster domain-containing protein [Myxococcota bacterium]
MSELDRRDFLKLVGVGAGAAATACAEPVEKLIPYVEQPESITPGIAVWYASTCTECPAACGLYVRTREGRPIKLEGNPDHPINQGKLCARGQASLGRTYLPDRYPQPMLRGAGGELEAATWEDATAQLQAGLGGGNGSTVVLGGHVGPSLGGVIDAFAAAAGAQRIVYEPFAYEALRSGTHAVFGVATLPIFDLGQADLIVDLGSDFLSSGLSPTENARQYADARDVKKHKSGGTRMIAFSPRLNLTTSSADQWLPSRAGSESAIAFAIAQAVVEAKGAPAGSDAAGIQAFVAGGNLSKAATEAGLEASELAAVVEAVLHAKNPLILPPGVASTGSNATSTAAAVMLSNALLGAVGTSVSIPPVEASAPVGLAEIKALVADMNAGKVKALLIHDSNPAYSLPAEIGFVEALGKVATVVSFASSKDETAELASLVLPDHTSMESWGDRAPRPGVRSIVQPTVRPLLDTQAIGDTLLEAGRALGGAMPEGSFRSVVENNWSDVDWRGALARGGVFTDTAIAPVAIQTDFSGLGMKSPSIGGDGEYTLVAFPHHFLGDGRGAALPWLQEIPEPTTKLQWNSWVEMSFTTAEKLGVGFGDVVSVTTPAGSIEGSVFPRGGIRDDTIAIPIGQGHSVGFYASMEGEGEHGGWSAGPEAAAGEPGRPRGANVMAVLPATQDESGGRVWLSTRAEVAKTGRFRRLALSQWTDNQRERKLAQVASLAQIAGHGGDDHHGAHHDEPPHTFTAAYDADPDQPYRWGMVIDNDRCNGCSACVASCSIENNVPVVGEAQAIQRRDMAWIRIEKYIGDGNQKGGSARRPVPESEKLGELDVRYIPMPCQQCGAAPCEAVCPTLATYHNKEGLNGMIYNRCAGTRYCANNCVYKVRRFNYFDYGNENFPGLLGLMLNPDVTVRQQGVMEKCSFCVQRIEGARQLAKDEDRSIRDGEVQTACQQACPTSAITFGNLRDEGSKVVAEADEPERSYHLLQELNTRPAITYLAQVTRDENEGNH